MATTSTLGGESTIPNERNKASGSKREAPRLTRAAQEQDQQLTTNRRNGTVDEYSLHKTLSEPSRTFKFPGVSGSVSAVRAMPNGRTLIWYVPPRPPYTSSTNSHHHSASYDILRQYDLTHPTLSSLSSSANNDTRPASTAATPFLIVPGHRTGVISQLYLDPTCSFMISTGGNRGWEGATTEVLLGYEISYGS